MTATAVRASEPAIAALGDAGLFSSSAGSARTLSEPANEGSVKTSGGPCFRTARHCEAMPSNLRASPPTLETVEARAAFSDLDRKE